MRSGSCESLEAQSQLGPMRFDTTPNLHYGDMEYVRRWDRLITEFREQVALCEAAGFTTFWLPEHHFGAIDGWNNSTPNPVLMCMDLAAHTKTLRVGTGGVAVPDWHPLRLAEDLAILDIACNGRLDCGVMKGASRRTNIQLFRQHDDPAATQRIFAEVIDILVEAWKEGPFSHEGEFYQFPVPGFVETNDLLRGDSQYYAPDGEYIALTVHPKPQQKPHPPLFMLGDSMDSHLFAAERGMPVMCYTPSASTVESNWRAYREAYATAHGRALAPGENLSIMKPIYVAPTMEQALADVRDGINLLFGRSALAMAGRKKYIEAGQALSAQDGEDDWCDFLHRHDILLAGTPDYVSEKIEMHRQRFGCEHMALFSNTPGLTHHQLMDNFALFGEQVVPRFRD